MKCEVLVSTMNKKNKNEITNFLNVKDCIIINQVTKELEVQNDDFDSFQKFITFKEKGLSRSRNNAIKNSTADICIVADDDMYYLDNYEELVTSAYEKYTDADLIAFVVDNEDETKRKKIQKEGKIGFLKSMKLQSVQVTFKRKSIVDNNISFDEKFGAGSIYPWGEENIFLFDCLRKGLKIYYVPVKIATLRATDETTWDRSNTVDHFNRHGIIYYRMSKKFYWILIIQFALRKRKIYKADMSTFETIKSMFEGVRKYKRGEL